MAFFFTLSLSLSLSFPCTAQERHGTRHNTASDDEQRNLFYDVESRYTFGRRVDPNRYLIELESTTQRKLAQVATHQP